MTDVTACAWRAAAPVPVAGNPGARVVLGNRLGATHEVDDQDYEEDDYESTDAYVHDVYIPRERPLRTVEHASGPGTRDGQPDERPHSCAASTSRSLAAISWSARMRRLVTSTRGVCRAGRRRAPG